jgi:hypothetical protein
MTNAHVHTALATARRNPAPVVPDVTSLVAVSRFNARIVGGARFVRLADEPGSAEIAVTVAGMLHKFGSGMQVVRG